MRRKMVRTVNLILIATIWLIACTGGSKSKSDSKETQARRDSLHLVDTVMDLKGKNTNPEFLRRMRLAMHKLDQLDSNWRKRYPHYEDTVQMMPGPEDDCVYMDSSSIAHLSDFEFLLYCCLKRETYMQACFMYFPATYSQTQKSIYLSYWTDDAHRINSLRLNQLKQNKIKNLLFLDSIVRITNRADSRIMVAASEVYKLLDTKSFLKSALWVLKNQGDVFYATAILDAIYTADIEFLKKSKLKNYFFIPAGEYKYPKNDDMELTHIPVNQKNLNLVIEIAENYLQKHP